MVRRDWPMINQIISADIANRSRAIPQRRHRPPSVPNHFSPVIKELAVSTNAQALFTVQKIMQQAALCNRVPIPTLITDLPILIHTERAAHIELIVIEKPEPQSIEPQPAVAQLDRHAAQIVERACGGKLDAERMQLLQLLL